MRISYLLAAAFIAAASYALCPTAFNRAMGDENDKGMSSSDRQKMEEHFFKDAASGNTLEIRLAKLAEQKATDPQVKQVAQTIQADHEQANQLLSQIAGQNHISVSTDSLNDVDSAQWSAIKKKDGEDFTRCYVFTMVGDHAMDELVYGYHANHEQNGACHEYASQVLPKIEMHLHELERIARPMAGLNGEEQPAAMHEAPEAK
jgi:putative membrane protein